MKEFQKGILDNDKVISAENVQRIGEVIALCAIKTVIVRGGKDLHNLYKGLLRDVNRSNDDMSRYSDGYDIAQEAISFASIWAKDLTTFTTPKPEGRLP